MGKEIELLAKMKANARGDWVIRDVETLCRQAGLSCSPPKSGSHYKVYSRHLAGTLTIPARRPIKPVYIKKLTSYAEAHLREEEQEGDER